MDLLAHLPPLQLAHLRAVMRDEAAPHRVHAARDWGDVDAVLRCEPVDVAVVDPVTIGGPSAGGTIVDPAPVIALRRRYRSLPIVVYTALAPGALRGVLALAREGLTDLVLHRFDDEPGRFRDLIEQMAGNALADALVARLASRLAVLPFGLADAVAECFHHPNRYGVAEDLAQRGGLSRRTLYRALAQGGLGSPSRVVKGARLLRAYGYLRDTGYSLEDVAVKCGFGSRQRFARHVRLLAGMQPRELRRHVQPAAFVDLLAARLGEPAEAEWGQEEQQDPA